VQPRNRTKMVKPCPPIPPLSSYGTLHGTIFQYSRNLVAFETSADPAAPPRKACILIGGLSDGLLPTPYTEPLEKACHALGWSLVQPILSSSYLGFGNGDLERDTSELSVLMLYLKHHRSADNFALIGHSTGCQNSIHFLKHGPLELVEMTKAVVLQAPVSDRECAMLQPNYDRNIEYALNLRSSGKEAEYMPRDAFWAPITAKRLLDLQEWGGADDFFSSDLSDEELEKRLSHVGKLRNLKLLVAYSGSDEYVPKTVNTKALMHRLVVAMNIHGDVANCLYLPMANHNLSGEHDGDIKIFLDNVSMLLQDAVPGT